MKCSNCGFETPNNSNFCSHCGEKIEFNNDFVSIDNGYNYEEHSFNEEPKQAPRYKEQDLRTVNTSASFGWFILGFICPIAGFIIGYLYMFKKPAIAVRCRSGAFYGMIVSIILMIVSYLI